MDRILGSSRWAAVVLLITSLGACAERSPTPTASTPDYAATRASVPPFVFPAGCCYYEGRIVRTVVPPASNPRQGRDPFYGFPGGAAAGQKGVVAVAPGDVDYHGGHWAFFAVTWNVTPRVLTSAGAVLAAAAAGDVSVTRVPDNDFKCPIQP